MSYADLEGLWVQAGGSPASAPLAAAIAMAESGGNPSSLNNNASTGDLSYGLWQINMIGSMGPQRERQFGINSYSQLLDPLTNAKAAVAVSNGGTNFAPWSTFKSGAYKKYLQGNVPPNMVAGGSGATAGGAGQPQTASVFSDVVSPVEHFVEGLFNWMFFGLLIITGGFLVMASVTVLTIGDTAGNLRPAGPVRATRETIRLRQNIRQSSPGGPYVDDVPVRTAPSAPPPARPVVENPAPKRITSERMDR